MYNAATDDTPSYGSKTKYQIKSLISIVNHKGTVDIVKNNFLRNGGTKGVIYLDMMHRTNTRRALIVNNEFTENAGLIESGVIFIRAHAPLERGTVYTRVPYDTGNALITALPVTTPTDDTEPDTQYYCSGYHFESNLFQRNMACTVYGGAMIKFECVNYNEVSSVGNDKITPTALTTATLASYKKINFANH